MTPESVDTLLLALLDGAFERPLWSTFLHELRRRTGADYASLIFRPPGLPENTVFHLYSGHRCPPVIQQLYRDRFYKEDPTPYHTMAEGRVYALDELWQKGDPAHDAYLQAIMVPSGMNAARMVRVEEATGVSAWLTITCDQHDFIVADDQLLTALVPYLRSVLRSYISLERARTDASLAGDAIRRLSYGWITLDPQGRVLETNDQGREILESSGSLRRDRQGLLTSSCAQQGRDIQEAVRTLAVGEAKPRAMIISREPWLDLLLVPASTSTVSAKAAPAVVAYVHGDSSLSKDRCEQLIQLFGLTPREAEVALSLGRGVSIAETAEAMGLTVESARTYSKKVYAKTGARGHADLVLFLHRCILQIS